jgi:SAM-dependent methyltransferase
VSRAELALARDRGADTAVLGRADRLPFPDRSFHSIACSMSLMLLQPLDVVLGELARVVEGDGTIVVIVPGRRPLTIRDLARYARLVATLRRARLAYPNDAAMVRFDHLARASGLRVVDDRRRRFSFELATPGDAELFVRSLYLPGAPGVRLDAAGALARRWVGSDIGIPLRRITLRRMQ